MLPASAGMILAPLTVDEMADRAPRIRGDDPATDLSLALNNAMLPASAGMIPAVSRQNRSPNGAPRIRGDDPSTSIPTGIPRRCSPHPRG